MEQTFKQNKIPRQRHAVIPNHEPIKVVYVKMVKEIVESEEKNREDWYENIRWIHENAL